MNKRSTKNIGTKKAHIGIIMGSESDLVVMQEACLILDELNIPYVLRIISAHRTPDAMYSFAKKAEDMGLKIIIAGAGGAAHLPGMTASLTHLPVIGVPIESKSLKGLDSLLSIVQMPKGVPVATVGINGGANAGLLAASILALTDESLSQKLIAYSVKLSDKIKKKDEELSKTSFKSYLKKHKK